MDNPQHTPPGGQSRPAQQQPTQPVDKTMAIVALVCAIVFPLVGLILAIVNLKKYPKGTDGHGMNKAALIISIILLLIFSFIMAIGAIAYFGVLSPTKMMPERTTFRAPLTNMDNAVVESDGTLAIPFMNSQGGTIMITGTVTGDQDCTGASLKQARLTDGTILDQETVVPNGELFILEIDCGPQSKGDSFRTMISFEYETSSTGMTRTHSGDVMATVR